MEQNDTCSTSRAACKQEQYSRWWCQTQLTCAATLYSSTRGSFVSGSSVLRLTFIPLAKKLGVRVGVLGDFKQRLEDVVQQLLKVFYDALLLDVVLSSTKRPECEERVFTMQAAAMSRLPVKIRDTHLLMSEKKSKELPGTGKGSEATTVLVSHLSSMRPCFALGWKGEGHFTDHCSKRSVVLQIDTKDM
ncbi:MAG: hypothetical protein FRX49_02485 [Trebouxia sp. A1-2]|nr:MAG: hypothetical protein FRX49_02485 [Trebouxia sp. A1-2]